MSQSFPPNPYGNQPRPGNPYVQGQPGQYPGYGQPGYPQFGPGGFAPPKKSGSSLFWILGIIGGLIFFCCLGCGGVGIAAMSWVANTESRMVKAELEKSPKAVEELGTPIEVKMNFGESIAHDDNDIFVFDVSGPKGKGKVRADCDAGDEIVFECHLDVNGKTIDVLEDNGSNSEDMDDEMIADEDEGVAPIEK